MPTSMTLTATQARKNFFSLLDDVYLSDKQYVIEKNGLPFAVVSKYTPNKSSLPKLAGSLSDIDAEGIIASINQARKTGSRPLHRE